MLNPCRDSFQRDGRYIVFEHRARQGHIRYRDQYSTAERERSQRYSNWFNRRHKEGDGMDDGEAQDGYASEDGYGSEDEYSDLE